MASKKAPKRATKSTRKPAPIEQFGVGKYCIIRSDRSGVHAGVVTQRKDGEAVLKDSRRLWYWKAKDGVALSGVAQHGISKDSKLDTVNPTMLVSGVLEVIPASKAAEESIRGF